jgi:hypothetical protein
MTIVTRVLVRLLFPWVLCDFERSDISATVLKSQLSDEEAPASLKVFSVTFLTWCSVVEPLGDSAPSKYTLCCSVLPTLLEMGSFIVEGTTHCPRKRRG